MVHRAPPDEILDLVHKAATHFVQRWWASCALTWAFFQQRHECGRGVPGGAELCAVQNPFLHFGGARPQRLSGSLVDLIRVDEIGDLVEQPDGPSVEMSGLVGRATVVFPARGHRVPDACEERRRRISGTLDAFLQHGLLHFGGASPEGVGSNVVDVERTQHILNPVPQTGVTMLRCGWYRVGAPRGAFVTILRARSLPKSLNFSNAR
mmetsp:Transcript_14623/g.40263  ORF Transcript_14623/g.40263 Transcript_14623/m.40263 type:complete len:208 (-) Transcript_14623:331-954(-)